MYSIPIIWFGCPLIILIVGEIVICLYINPINEKVIIDISVINKNNYFLNQLRKYNEESIKYFKVKLEHKICDLERKRHFSADMGDKYLSFLALFLLIGTNYIIGLDVDNVWITSLNIIGIPLYFIFLILLNLLFKKIRPKVINHYEDFLAIIKELEIER